MARLFRIVPPFLLERAEALQIAPTAALAVVNGRAVSLSAITATTALTSTGAPG